VCVDWSPFPSSLSCVHSSPFHLVLPSQRGDSARVGCLCLIQWTTSFYDSCHAILHKLIHLHLLLPIGNERCTDFSVRPHPTHIPVSPSLRNPARLPLVPGKSSSPRSARTTVLPVSHIVGVLHHPWSLRKVESCSPLLNSHLRPWLLRSSRIKLLHPVSCGRHACGRPWCNTHGALPRFSSLPKKYYDQTLAHLLVR
jgi:hypothetical protein